MFNYMGDLGIDILKDKILVSAETDGCNEIVFKTDTGETYKMHHYQSCCEQVNIEDINGDLADLVGSPILLAEESSNSDEPKGTQLSENYTYYDESFTWTFYKLATIKGSVTIRWYGTSNGYYSESVSFCKVS